MIIVDGQSATRITATVIKEYEKATLYDCEGDEVWVPHSVSRYNAEEEELDIQDWFFQKLENEGKL
jgi:hypothetical protein